MIRSFMKKYLFLLLSFALMAAPLSAAQKSAYANSTFIVSKLPARQVVAEELTQMRDKFTQEGRQLSESFQKKYAEVLEQNKSGLLSDADLKAAQAELQQMQADIQAHTQKSQEAIARRQQVLLDPIIKKVEEAIKKVAEDEGYDFVFDTREAGLVYGNNEYDITVLVLQELGVEVEVTD